MGEGQVDLVELTLTASADNTQYNLGHQAFRWSEMGSKVPKRKPRSAFIEGWSLHADTHVHERDRLGLERLCRYGSRGALSLERLSRREDGLYVYRMKKAKPNGICELVLTGVQLLKKLTALVPPPKVNLVRFFWRLRTRLPHKSEDNAIETVIRGRSAVYGERVGA